MESNEVPLQLYDLSAKGVKTSSIHESFLGMTRLPGYSDINVKGDILKTPKNTQTDAALSKLYKRCRTNGS